MTVGGPHICLAVEGDNLMGPYANYDHEVVRRPASEAPTELAMRPTWEVVATRFALPS
jgi:hypothetical protein